MTDKLYEVLFRMYNKARKDQKWPKVTFEKFKERFHAKNPPTASGGRTEVPHVHAEVASSSEPPKLENRAKRKKNKRNGGDEHSV